MNDLHALLLILTAAAVTICLRFLPFLIFGGKKKTPGYITYLGNVLPFAIIGILVVYCLKNVSLAQAPYGLPEGMAVVFVVLLHLWKRNTLISVAGGTIFYMLLIQSVF